MRRWDVKQRGKARERPLREYSARSEANFGRSDARSGGPFLFSRSHKNRSLLRRRRHARVGQPISLNTSQLWQSWRWQQRTEWAIASWTRSSAMQSRLRQSSQRAEAYPRAGQTTPTYSRSMTSSSPLHRASLYRTKILNCCR